MSGYDIIAYRVESEERQLIGVTDQQLDEFITFLLALGWFVDTGDRLCCTADPQHHVADGNYCQHCGARTERKEAPIGVYRDLRDIVAYCRSNF